MQTLTKVQREPPSKPPVIATGYSDHIRDIGDQIAALCPVDAAELRDYLAREGMEAPR